MQRKFGIFSLLVGIALVSLFVLSDMAQAVDFGFLLVGTLLLLLGIGLLITNPVPPVESSARFRLLKRIMDREEKEKGKDKRK